MVRAYRNKRQFLTRRQQSSNYLATAFLLSAVMVAASVGLVLIQYGLLAFQEHRVYTQYLSYRQLVDAELRHE